jgi:hypothetical protein
MFSFYDILDESSEKDDLFNTNIFLEDEFDIDTSLDDMPKVDDQSPQADQQAEKAVDNDQGSEGQDNSGDDSGEDAQEPEENPDGEEGSGEAPEGGDQPQGDEAEEPVEANTDIFSSLSADEQSVKIFELQRLYAQLYNSCNDISKRINDLDTDEKDLEIISRVGDSITQLKKYIEDYLTKHFSKKSFVENDIMYNRFLAILSSITSVLQELSKSRDKITKENTEHNGKK